MNQLKPGSAPPPAKPMRSMAEYPTPRLPDAAGLEDVNPDSVEKFLGGSIWDDVDWHSWFWAGKKSVGKNR